VKELVDGRGGGDDGRACGGGLDWRGCACGGGDDCRGWLGGGVARGGGDDWRGCWLGAGVARGAFSGRWPEDCGARPL